MSWDQVDTVVERTTNGERIEIGIFKTSDADGRTLYAIAHRVIPIWSPQPGRYATADEAYDAAMADMLEYQREAEAVKEIASRLSK